MRSIEIEPPFPAFADRNGQPLENGFINIGAVNLNPITNPIDVYWDAAQTIPAEQPIRTLAGYPVFMGTPARFFVDEDYSVQVKDKNGSVVYTSLNGNIDRVGSGALVANATGTGSQTVFPLAFSPGQIFINGVYQNQNTYTSTSGAVTFSEAPPFTSIIEFVF